MCGLRYDESWHTPGVQADFYDVKGLVENIATDLNLSDLRFSADAPWPYLHPGRSCRIHVNNEMIGYLGEVHPRVMEALDLRNRAVIVELDLEPMMKAGRKTPGTFVRYRGSLPVHGMWPSSYPRKSKSSACWMRPSASVKKYLKRFPYLMYIMERTYRKGRGASV